MKFQSIVSHLSKIKLDQFQIKQILNMVEKYIVANETAATPAISSIVLNVQKGILK